MEDDQNGSQPRLRKVTNIKQEHKTRANMSQVEGGDMNLQDLRLGGVVNMCVYKTFCYKQ